MNRSTEIDETSVSNAASQAVSARFRWLLPILTAILGLAFLLALPAAIFLVNNRPPNIVVPTPKMPKPNGWDDFVKAGDLLRKVKRRSPYSDMRPLKSWTMPEYEAFMRENAPILDLVRQGLKKPYSYPPVRTLDGPSPNYAKMREIARAFLGEARYLELTGRLGDAADSRLDCIELGVTLPRGGPLITALVAQAVESIGMKDFAQLHQHLSPDELARVAERLEHIQEKRVRYRDIILEEGRSATAIHADWFRDPECRKDLADPRNWTQSLSDTDPMPVTVWRNMRYALTNKTAMLRQNEAYYQALAREQRKPYSGPSSVPLPHNVWAEMGCLDTVSEVREVITRREALLTLLQTEVALRRYRFDHGAYPNRLSLLTPKYLKATPIDPFGQNKPLRYMPLDNGREFLLYSVGPNLKDDGGRAARWEGPETQGDIVPGK